MTITVHGPSGITIDFPDGTDHDTINKVMTQAIGGGKDAAPAPDQYQQAAKADIAAAKASGASEGAGFTRRLAHGATLGADSTILAGLETPLEMIKRGTFNPAEGYRYAKAREDQIMQDARDNTGGLGTAAEILGGGVSGAGLANAGITAGRFLAPNAGLLARSAASAADAAGLGGFTGAMEGNGLQERITNAAKGAALGGVLGGVAPTAMSVLGGVAAPIFANVKARINPAGYAEGQVARAIHESGVSPDELALRAVQAANEGQPQFTLADAMGNPGQRMLSTVARAPGEGRTAVVDALESRQAGQGRRVASALAEGFESPQTAAQTRQAMTAARDQAADAEYGAVRSNGGRVDVAPAINNIDRVIGTQPGEVIPQKPIWEPPQPKGIPPISESAPEGPKAQSLLEFLAQKGGLGPDAELQAIGASKHIVNVDGVGRRGLVKQGGLPLDYAREAAEEAGYLRGDVNKTATVKDLLDAIDAEIRGQKLYPEGFAGYKTKREVSAMNDRAKGEYDNHLRSIENELSAAGHAEIGPELKARAVSIMSRDGVDADTAVERAFRQLEQEDAVRSVSDFPGDKPFYPSPIFSKPTIPPSNDSIEGALRPFRERLARVNPDDFEAVQRIRGDMADAAQSARQAGNGNRARLIGQAVRELDASMEAASPGYRQANANFRQRSQDIEAIDAGRQAAMRGRPEDTIPTFQAQSQAGQRAFRTGYADPLIERAQSGAFGANKARPLTSDAFRDEAAAIAPGNDMMQRRLGREMTMFETRNAALGGSKTADNLNDHAAMAVDPHLIGQVVSGNWHGAIRTALAAGHNALSGNTPAVRREVANILLQNGGNISAHRLREMVNNTVARIQFVQGVARNVGRGAAGGLAVAAPSQYRNR